MIKVKPVVGSLYKYSLSARAKSNASFLFLFVIAVLDHVKTVEAKDVPRLSGKFEYFTFGMVSNKTKPNQRKGAASGIARLALTGLTNQKAESPNYVQLTLDHKHGYTEIPPSSYVISSMGGFGLIQPAFSDIGLRLTSLYWAQTFNQQESDMMIGFLDSTDYIDTYLLGNPYLAFPMFNSVQAQGQYSFQTSPRWA